jgi:hypothetical protein
VEDLRKQMPEEVQKRFLRFEFPTHYSYFLFGTREVLDGSWDKKLQEITEKFSGTFNVKYIDKPS